jgi:hypothetical protein
VKVYAGHAENKLRRLDQASSPVKQNQSVSEPRHPGAFIGIGAAVELI